MWQPFQLAHFVPPQHPRPGHALQYDATSLPRNLNAFLDSARCCSNPTCEGVYFTHRVRSVEFVDFCGKYRVPLLKFLCSKHDPAPTKTPSDDKVRLVLLTGYTEDDTMDFQWCWDGFHRILSLFSFRRSGVGARTASHGLVLFKGWRQLVNNAAGGLHKCRTSLLPLSLSLSLSLSVCLSVCIHYLPHLSHCAPISSCSIV